MNHINIGNRKINYIEQGEGMPILFGHSYLWDSNMWQPQIAELSQKYRCIVPDLWGHGDSQILKNNNYSLTDLAQDYGTFMNALNIDQYAVIGLSVGGMWGAHLALNYPDKVTALVLMGTDLGDEPQEQKLRYFGMIDIIEKTNTIPNDLIEIITPLFFSPTTFKNKPNLIQEFKKKLSEISPDNIKTIATLGRCIFSRTSILEQLKKIKIPTQIIVGNDDVPRPVHEAQRLNQTIVDSKLSIISDAGHICNLEQPEEINVILSNFLSSIS